MNTLSTYQPIIGKSKAVSKLFETIEKVAETNANVLILGENGTGKGLVAKALHKHSLRSNGPFVDVDVAAISEQLFESELFGHTKGAFTDAKEKRDGRFKAADGGTLFLDEIGNLPMSLQVKLLSCIQQRAIRPLGANKLEPVNIRLICATNVNLREKVASHQFRQDLLYRINTVEIYLPPLRERMEDVPLLLDYFIKTYSQKYGKIIKGISRDALQFIEDYHWPGNIRELRHAIERAIIMTEHDCLQAQDFSFRQADPGEMELKLDSFNLEKVEKIVIQKAIRKYEGNITRAAQELGLTRTSLYRRIEKYGL